MISWPFSAWTLRIENISSCLRRVDAPSMPSSSAMATRSAGEFFFKSLRCIGGYSIGRVDGPRGIEDFGGWGCLRGRQANDLTGVRLRDFSSQGVLRYGPSPGSVLPLRVSGRTIPTAHPE